MKESASFTHIASSRPHTPEKPLSGRILWWKTLTFTQQDAAFEQPFSHHGDQTEAPGKGPKVMRNAGCESAMCGR